MLNHLLQFTRAVIAVILFPLLLISCAKKSYVLQLGDEGRAHVNSSFMQNELINGDAEGPFLYCSVPEDATVNPCPAIN